MARIKVVDLKVMADPDDLATGISLIYDRWKMGRARWEKEKKEIRDYIFATDTSTTTNSQNPWKNSTILPKLCQIRDNLHANYMAALFPHEDWLDWKPADEQSANRLKANIIKAYIKNKLVASQFETTVSQLVLDYIDYGNAFAEVVYEDEDHTLPDGNIVSGYKGPKIRRLSPLDIVFDVTAESFRETPKIVRSLVSVGQLMKMAKSVEYADWATTALDRMQALRLHARGMKPNTIKLDALRVDGFTGPWDYLTSGMVEILEFQGDFYDPISGILYENQRIVVADRMYVLLMHPYKSWLGRSNIEHVGWRQRPDNLMAMGPLDNLVGMQYRVDHLENLKADVFDHIATPVVYHRGLVEQWEWGPGQRIYGDVDSDVKMLVPDTTALNADTQIAGILNLMEEMAGAPRQAMGIRTPGEKTAFEVQSLDNAAGRTFQNKVSYFERNLLEPLLNQALESARRNLLTSGELIGVPDDDQGALEFMNITPQDITATGKLVPMGARHFARKAQLLQNLNNLANSAIYQDPAVQVHISGVGLAQTVEDLLEIDRFRLVAPNIRLQEQQETASMQQIVQQQLVEEQAAAADNAAIQAQDFQDGQLAPEEDESV